MGLTQVSTDGVKNDAITKTKIPANQIEASELADNAVDTNAIANDAVTNAKIAAGVVNTSELTDNAVTHTKYQDIPTSRLLGRTSSGTGSPETLDASTVRTFLNVADGATASSGTTISNNADNRVITGSGTANTLNAESGVVIDSSGRVGIGNTNAGSFHSSGNNLVVGSGSGDEGMTFYTGNGSSAAINFADGTSGSESYMGRVLYRHSDNAMTFHTNTGAERLRIDSSGRLLVGLTSGIHGDEFL